MKRVFLILVVLLGMPIVFEACCKDDAYIINYTYEGLNLNLYKNPSTVAKESDTLTQDTIALELFFKSKEVAIDYDFLMNPYSAYACEQVADYFQINSIESVAIGFLTNGDIKNLDTTIQTSLLWYSQRRNYDWASEKEPAILDLRNGNIWGSRRVVATFLSPHNSKSIHFAVLAIKENGDTLKAVSPRVFCQ